MSPSELPPDLDFDVSNTWRLGLVGGVLADLPVTQKVNFVTGGLVSTRGGKVNVTVTGVGSLSVDFRMIYADVPLLLRAPVVRAGNCVISILGGGMMGLRLHARSKVSIPGDSETDTFTDELPVLDFGVAVGARADFDRASVVVYYNHGLSDTTKGDAPAPIKHRVFSVLAGWRF